MIADAILDCTGHGERVIDCFLGSGTTLIAADRTGRICHGMDLDPLYVDVAIRRWQAWTGLDAIDADSGRPFNDLASDAQSRKKGTIGDYEVGYGKPPRQHQFQPNTSGFKGRRKKPPEQQAEMIARIRDEVVIVNGKRMSKLELAVQRAFNETIKSGKTRDLKVLMDLLDKYGAIPKWDRDAQTRAGADEALRKIFETFDRTMPEESPAHRRANPMENSPEG